MNSKRYEDTVKIFIKCPYEMREDAKSFGAKWCKDNKKWYMQTISRYMDWIDYIEPLDNKDVKKQKQKLVVKKQKHVLKGNNKIKNHITIGKNYSESSDKSTPWN